MCERPRYTVELPGLGAAYDDGARAAANNEPMDVPDCYQGSTMLAGCWMQGWIAVACADRELPPDPMIIDFKGDALMAKLICYTHRFVNTETGEKLINPDGSDGIIYADEATGEVRYYKSRPTKDGSSRVKYHTRADGKPITRWRTRILERLGIYEEKVIAKETYYAPVRFVPIAGEEELALQVRGLYQQREHVNNQLSEMLDRRFPYSPK